MNPPSTLYLYAPGHYYLMPYFEREFSDFAVVSDPPVGKLDFAVMVSTADICKDSERERREDMFKRLCAQRGVTPCILRVPHVVATGMSGFPMRMARGIARGTLMHIKGNDAVIPVIHGVDVAQYAHALLGKDVVVEITDGTQTTVDQLIDALARRIKDKTVYSLSPKWARLFYGKEYYTQLTTSQHVDDTLARQLAPDVVLHPVAEYLTTHIYDDESL